MGIRSASAARKLGLVASNYPIQSKSAQALKTKGNAKVSTLSKVIIGTCGLIGGVLTAFLMKDRLISHFNPTASPAAVSPFQTTATKMDRASCQSLNTRFSSLPWDDKLTAVETLRVSCANLGTYGYADMFNALYQFGSENFESALEQAKKHFGNSPENSESYNTLLNSLANKAIKQEKFQEAKKIIEAMTLSERSSAYSDLLYGVAKQVREGNVQNLHLLKEIEKNAPSDVKNEIRFFYLNTVSDARHSVSVATSAKILREIAKIHPAAIQDNPIAISKFIEKAIHDRNYKAALEVADLILEDDDRLKQYKKIHGAVVNNQNHTELANQIHKKIEGITNSPSSGVQLDTVIELIKNKDFEKAESVADAITDVIVQGRAYEEIILAHKGREHSLTQISRLLEKLNNDHLHAKIQEALTTYQDYIDSYTLTDEDFYSLVGKFSSIEWIDLQGTLHGADALLQREGTFSDLMALERHIENQWQQIRDDFKRKQESHRAQGSTYNKQKATSFVDDRFEFTKKTTVDEVKKAFRQYALLHHPDKHPNDRAAKVKLMMEATDVRDRLIAYLEEYSI